MNSRAKIGFRTDRSVSFLQGLLLAAILVLLCSVAASATVMFISPDLDVPVRRGSSDKYKIIKMAKISDRVELLEEKDNWCRVRFKDNTEGWLPKHLLTSELPAVRRLQDLLEENKEVKRKNDDLSVELAALQEHQNGESEKLSACIAERNVAKAERRAVEDTAKVMWFLAGSGVLFIGWILGRISGRPRRKRSTLSLH